MPACHAGGRGFESRPDRQNRIQPSVVQEITGGFVFQGTLQGTVLCDLAPYLIQNPYSGFIIFGHPNLFL